MQKPKPIAADPSLDRKLGESQADRELCNAYRKARVDALRWRLEYREKAWEMSQLLAARIHELLSIPAVKTISRPGREPQVVPRDAGAAYTALKSLVGSYALLGKAALAPLPTERVVKAVLADNAGLTAGGEGNDAARKAVPQATAAAPGPSHATKCNVLQRNCGRVNETPGAIEPARDAEATGIEKEPTEKVA